MSMIWRKLDDIRQIAKSPTLECQKLFTSGPIVTLNQLFDYKKEARTTKVKHNKVTVDNDISYIFQFHIVHF